MSACIGSATERSSQERTASQRKKKTASMAVPRTSLGEVSACRATFRIPFRFMAEMSPSSFMPRASRMSPMVPAITAISMTIAVLNISLHLSAVVSQADAELCQLFCHLRAR